MIVVSGSIVQEADRNFGPNSAFVAIGGAPVVQRLTAVPTRRGGQLHSLLCIPEQYIPPLLALHRREVRVDLARPDLRIGERQGDVFPAA